jgi:hypothetical protein
MELSVDEFLSLTRAQVLSLPSDVQQRIRRFAAEVVQVDQVIDDALQRNLRLMQEQLQQQLVPLIQQHFDASFTTTTAAIQELTKQHADILSALSAVNAQANANHDTLVNEVTRLRDEIQQGRLTEIQNDSFCPPVHQLQSPASRPLPSPPAPHGLLRNSAMKFSLHDLPLFTAEDKSQRPDRWLFRAKRMLQVMEVDESQWVLYATLRLDGAALAWWQMLELGGEAPADWADFAQGLKDQFGSINPEQSARDTFWYHLRQQTTVREYIKEFRSLLLELPTVDDGTKKDRFIQGLKDSVRHEVVLREPSTLIEAMSLAERSERATSRVALYSRPRSYAQAVMNPRPAPPSFPQRRPVRPDVVMAEPQRIPRLTDEERERLRATGSCFRCRQPGHTSYQCRAFEPRRPAPTPTRPLAYITTDETEETASQPSNN